MTEQEARLILQSYRPGGEDKDDPQFAEALREAERNPELARWLAEEQAFDCAMAAQLASAPGALWFENPDSRPGRAAFRQPHPWSLAAILAGVVALLFLARAGRWSVPAGRASPGAASRQRRFPITCRRW